MALLQRGPDGLRHYSHLRHRKDLEELVMKPSLGGSWDLEAAT